MGWSVLPRRNHLVFAAGLESLGVKGVVANRRHAEVFVPLAGNAKRLRELTGVKTIGARGAQPVNALPKLVWHPELRAVLVGRGPGRVKRENAILLQVKTTFDELRNGFLITLVLNPTVREARRMRPPLR